MNSKKVENILNLIEIAENNLRNARSLLQQSLGDKPLPPTATTSGSTPTNLRSIEEDRAIEVVEGYFNGESMIGDNGQTYIVPPNYASKTQLVVGDRLKWILTNDREVYKLIQPVDRERVTGTFGVEGDTYMVLVDSLPHPVKILKASATYAMKNLGLHVGDEVAILIPKNTTPTWGAFSSVVRSSDDTDDAQSENIKPSKEELENITKEFSLDNFSIDSDKDYF